MKIRELIKKIPMYVLLMTLTIIVAFSFFYRINIYYDIAWYSKIISCLCGIIILYLLFVIGKKIQTISLSKRKEKVLIVVLHLSLLFLLFLSYCFLRIGLNNGDLSMLYGSANRVVNHMKLEPIRIHYFENFPHQMFALFFFEVVIKISNVLKISAFHLLPFINCIFIYISIYFVDKIIKLKYNNRIRILFLIICYFVSPLFLFVPIFYTDTLSMPFAIGAYYYFLLFWKSHHKKRKILYFFIMCLLLAVGANIKTTVLIVMIAFIIGIFIEVKDNKKSIIYIFSLIILTLGLFKCISISTLYLNPLKVTKEKALPYSHWIMMGLGEDEKSYGGYYQEDYKITEAEKNIEDMKKTNLKVIKERIKNKGFLGYINFVIHKLEVTWMDGAFVAPFKYEVYGLYKDNKALYNIVNPNGNYFDLFIFVIQTFHYMIICGVIYSLYLMIKNKNGDNYISCYILLGAMTFFALWETRSRYILNVYLYIILILIPMFNIENKRGKE